MIPLPVTSVTAALLGLLYIVLSARVIMARGAAGASLGDGSTGVVGFGQECDAPLLARVRSHGNFAEYVPFALVLMAFAELEGTQRVVMIVLAALLTAGRLAHPLGMSRKAPNPYRLVGVVFTFGAIAGAAIAILVNLGRGA